MPVPITLTFGGETVELSADMKWQERHSWAPVEQTAVRSITGAMIVQAQARIAGRPITLAPPDEGAAWASGAAVAKLREWAALTTCTMALAMREYAGSVIFRHHDGPALDAELVEFVSDPDSGDWYLVTLRLMEV